MIRNWKNIARSQCRKWLFSSVADIERTKIELTAYKRSIENADKRIEELKEEIKEREEEIGGSK